MPELGVLTETRKYILYSLYQIRGYMKEAKLFLNGKSQAVRLPKAFRFPGTSVFVKRHGPGVLLLPTDVDPWSDMSVSLQQFAPDLTLSREQGPHQERSPIAPVHAAPAKPKRRHAERKRPRSS